MSKYSKKDYKRRDVERELADKFIESLNLINEGILTRPTWIAGWDSKLGRPRNGLSGHQYRGINVLMTLLSGYSDPRWYTRNQILERCPKGNCYSSDTDQTYCDACGQLIEDEAAEYEAVALLLLAHADKKEEAK